MSKKLIITEDMAKRIITDEMLEESGFKKSDIVDAVKDVIKNDRSVNQDFDKKVKSLVANAVNVLFKTLWQRRNFYEDEIKRG